MITRKELIKKYLDFFKSKEHKEIPNSSLVPENDPTVLFTTAGMHPIVPFLLGQKHPQGNRLMNVQKCIRTGDIDEVGNTCHHTFFEMIGNWSLGDYWKKDALTWSFEFATKILKLDKKRLAISCFAGDKRAQKDKESAKIWESLGMPKEKIVFLKDNWWGPAGETGPCGPDTEMFYWSPNSIPIPDKFDPNDSRWLEIWNDVLMQYTKDKEGNYNEAKQKNIDNGRGLERVLAVINNLEDNYLTDIWQPIIKEIEKLSGKKYSENKKEMRIIADHIKASVFIIADGITPSNTEQGYVLRRLIRKAVRYAKKLGIPQDADLTTPLVEGILKIYSDYDILKKNKNKIIDELNKEEAKFELTLEKGLKELEKLTKSVSADKKISGQDAFLLYQSYGFPLEMIDELAMTKGLLFSHKEFRDELTKHQELSRTASAGQFKSGLADNGEATTKLHTATHLLLQSLKIILKDENIIQKGSNITPERIRFDFAFPRKLTPEEIQQIEDLVNAQIQDSCEITLEEMSPDKAKQQGACGIFDKKYGEIVSVYTIQDKNKKVFSKEICTGPHVKNTCEIGKFKITKEESSSSGIRRIKAVLE